MPHERSRFSHELVTDELRWSPVVGVYGLRQVGKTTLVQDIVEKKGGIYENFDREAVLSAAEQAPVQFCDRERLLCIDEAQKCPKIFLAIKELIGTKRMPGRFLLTGSLRFMLKKDIRESLTGRIALHELLPFNPAEVLQISLSDFFSESFDAIDHDNKLKKFLTRAEGSHRQISTKDIYRFMTTGGMPIPCFARDKNKRTQWYQDYFETLLLRDSLLVDPSLKQMTYRQGMMFLHQLSLLQGELLNINQLAYKSLLSPSEAKRLLMALHTLALIDFTPSEIRKKKSVRKMHIEWKDIGLWNHFMDLDAERAKRDITAQHLLISQELRTQLNFNKKNVVWLTYQNRDGARCPWVFKQGTKVMAILYLPTEAPQKQDYRILQLMKKEYKHFLGIILGGEKSPVVMLDKNILFLPFTKIF